MASTAVVPRLEVRHLSKTFGRRKVLDELNLTVGPGEMHGLVGQNGSGKSTFVKALSGYHSPDSGAEVLIDGRPLRLPIHPAELRAVGVSIVHQDLGLIEEASVVENVRIAAMTGRRWSHRINWRREIAAAKSALDRLGYRGSLRAPVRTLTPQDRARVAIGRAIQDHLPGRGLIVFDESTRALPADALEVFYATVRQLLEDGTGVLMIGHHLGEILTHCDRVTVLRDGHPVAEGLPTEGLSESALATQMLGHALKQLDFESSQRPEEHPAVRLRRVSGPGVDTPIDLELRADEIVGLTGLPGSGFESVPYLLAGARAGTRTSRVGRRARRSRRCLRWSDGRRGVVLVPENRSKEGLSLEHTVAENISLPWLSQRGRRWLTGRRWQVEESERAIGGLGIVPPNPHQVVGRLSGGNAQKVLLGKWLMGGPSCCCCTSPPRESTSKRGSTCCASYTAWQNGDRCSDLLLGARGFARGVRPHRLLSRRAPRCGADAAVRDR